MDDDRLALEYLAFVKAVNSDWTIPDKDGDISGDDALREVKSHDRIYTPRERKMRRNAVKAVRKDGCYNVRRKSNGKK